MSRFSLPPVPLPTGPEDKGWPDVLVAVLDEAFRNLEEQPIVPTHSNATAAENTIGTSFEEVASIEKPVEGDVLIMFSCQVEVVEQAGSAASLTLRIQRDGTDVWAEKKVLGTGFGSATIYGTVSAFFIDTPGGGGFKWDADMKSSSGTWKISNVTLFILELRG